MRRHPIGLFLILVGALASPFYVFLLTSDPPVWSSVWAFAFMWTPGLAALLAQVLTKGTVRGLGWGRPKRPRDLLLAFGAPMGAFLLVYALVWASGLGDLDVTRVVARFAAFGVPEGTSSVVLVALVVVLVPLGVGLGCLSTLGEELGWRGYLTPHVVERFGWARGSLLIGLVWSLWHYPLMWMLLPRYRPVPGLAWSVLCFTLSVTGIAFFYTWLRLRNASVWPAVVLHAASASAQELGEGLTRHGSWSPYLTFEYGLGFVLVIALLLGCSWRRMARDVSSDASIDAATTPPL